MMYLSQITMLYTLNLHSAVCPEKAMAPHSSTLVRKIPWTEEPGGLQSMGWLRVGHDWATSLSLFTFMHWRRKWQPTPVFLPGESQGWGSLVGRRLWGGTESATTKWLSSSRSSVYMSMLLSQFIHPPFPCWAHKSILFLCVSVDSLQIGSSVPFF